MAKRLALLLMLCALPVAQADELLPDDFARGQYLSVDGTQPFYRLRLPAHVYTGVAHADLRDLRVFNGHGEQMPMSLVNEPPGSNTSTQRVSLQAFQLPAGESSALASAQLQVGDQSVQLNWSTTPEQKPMMLLVAPGTTPPLLNSLRLDWLPVGSSWEQRIQVESSNDLRDWQVLVQAQPLLELQQDGQQLRVDSVHFPETRARYWRLTLDRSPAPVIRTAEGVHEVQHSNPALTWLPMPLVDSPKAHERIYRLPVALRADYVRISLPQANSVVPYQLRWRSRADEEWQSLPAGVAWRLPAGQWQSSSPPRELGGMEILELRLSSRSGWGQGDPQLELGRRNQHLLFNARGSGPWLLAWGSLAASSHYLAPEMLIPGFRDDKLLDLSEALPEVQQELGGERRRLEPGRSEIQARWQTRLLWLALLCGTAILALLAWKLWRELPVHHDDSH